MIAPKPREGYRLYCDICGYCETEEFDYFDEAVEYKKENGWISEKCKNDWQDICPECQEGQVWRD